MAPPELPRNAPVADIAQPVEVNCAPVLGNDLDFPPFDHSDGRLSQRLHAHEPLRGGPGLDDRLAAVAGADGVGVVDDAVEQALRLQVFDHAPARLEAVQARVLARRGAHATVVSHHVNFGQVRSEEHTSELQSLAYLVCRLLLEKKKKTVL